MVRITIFSYVLVGADSGATPTNNSEVITVQGTFRVSKWCHFAESMSQ